MPVVMGDAMTYEATNMTDYLAGLRTDADVAASPTLSNSEVLTYIRAEALKLGGSAVNYETLGDDSNGARVYRLGTLILLQDISTQLAALVTASSIRKIPGAAYAYSCNPHLRG